MSIAYNGMTDNGHEVFLIGESYISYEQFVTNLVKDMGSQQLDLIHMLMGITGEAGELMDAIKKHTIYGKPLDNENVVEELGDLEFYMAGLRQMLGVSREEVLRNNFNKLRQRYASGSYSDAAAIARADKQLVDPAGQPMQSTELEIIDPSKQPAQE